MRAGGESRCFSGLDDPLGRPIGWDHRPMPVLNLDRNELVLPEVVGEHSLEELNRLELLLRLSPPQAVAIVRAARLYEDALWIVESEPSLAWLMIVSSLETAANQWQTEDGTAVERLTDAKPDLVKILKATGGDSLVETVAAAIEPSLGATRKFVKFMLHFLPPAPKIRPSEPFQILWDERPMKKIFTKVYEYRSKALHEGKPFPAPMCAPACKLDVDGYVEKGTFALAEGSCGGVWKANAVPISLHTFHHIARGVLLKWWENMACGGNEAAILPPCPNGEDLTCDHANG